MGTLKNDKIHIEYASFGTRFHAWLIDLILLFIIIFFLNLTYFQYNFHNKRINDFLFVLIFYMIIGYSILLPLLGLIYSSLFESSKFQGTPGKIILGIVVVDENFQRIGLLKSILRNFMKIFSGMFFCVGYIIALQNQKCLTWHDMVVKTYVVRKINRKNLIQ